MFCYSGKPIDFYIAIESPNIKNHKNNPKNSYLKI